MKQIVTMLMALLFVTLSAGYTANITATKKNNTVYIHINAYHDTDKVYNACDIELQYDAEKLRFNQDKSTLGCAPYRDIDGRLVFIDFGADKLLGESIYVLAFDVIGKGKTEVKLNKATFCTKEKAASSNMEPTTNKPNSITLWVK